MVLNADEIVHFLEASPAQPGDADHGLLAEPAHREVVRPTFAAIDSHRMLIRVLQGKGGKDPRDAVAAAVADPAPALASGVAQRDRFAS